ncbi:hypothetical protein DVH24_037091 [Malus domestica]|uniref:Uncharacterized protein n=1 Tax=Malus domestica TaxID=3750 RepID=A0A498HIT9_MALDO|nr:hypothetical protein DVH24_037091 [Malus domestica]
MERENVRAVRVHKGCVWYVGRDGTERDEAFRPAFGAPKMGGTGCSTGQILGVFASHLPPWNGFVPHKYTPCLFQKLHLYSVPSRPVCVPNAPKQIYPCVSSLINRNPPTVPPDVPSSHPIESTQTRNFHGKISPTFSTAKHPNPSLISLFPKP